MLDRKTFRQRLDTEVLILDGAMGTMIQSRIDIGGCFDALTVSHPDVVRGIHAAYMEAGADIISTNTFGANRIKLGNHGQADSVLRLNIAAAKLARESAQGKCWIAGCIGPTGKLVEPLGELTFDEAYDCYREQVLALAEGGVDLFLLETFSDLKECRIAVLAVHDMTDLPLMASMTYGDDYVTFTGTDPVTAGNVLESMGVDVLGVNCSTGPEPMLEILGRYATTVRCPLLIEPNAGLPQTEGGDIAYTVDPAAMAGYSEQFVDLGANIVGSCCGSTPAYTETIRHRIKKKKPLQRKIQSVLQLSSRNTTVPIGLNQPFCVVGERINPTNRDELTKDLVQGKISTLLKDAEAQADEGASVLDVNLGVPDIDEVRMMGRAVRGIENSVACPLCIDTIHPASIEAALRETAGKPLINSVNGEEGSLKSILPLAKRYGAAILCLAVGEGKIPKTAEERFGILKRIVREALKAGIRREDLICDCVTLTVSAQQKRAEETLRAVKMISKEMELPTILGVSNISFGLPERSLINASFLSMAMASGLDSAIMNPGDTRMMETVQAASVLTVRDPGSRSYVEKQIRKRKNKSVEDRTQLYLEDAWKIPRTILSGNREEVGPLVEQALSEGKTALEINEELLIPAIQEVGKKYDRKEIYLPQMILSAETMQRALEVLEPYFESGDRQHAGCVMLCTVKGDVHDIGKNIVALFLKNHGFHVIDLGKDVTVDTILECIDSHHPDILGLSALMTTTMPEMRSVVRAVKESKRNVRIILGGAVVTQRYADEIGADGYARDGVSAVQLVRRLLNGDTV